MRSLSARGPVFFFAFVLGASAVAAERTNPNLAEPRTASAPSSTGEHERVLHFGGNFGFGSIAYKGSLKSDVDDYRRNANAMRTGAFYFDGFMGWRLANGKTVIGPALTVLLDSYNSDSTSDLSVTTVFASAMIQHYFSGNIHEGFFVRIDLGLIDTELSDTPTTTHNNTRTSPSYGGTGLRAGLGYSIPVIPSKKLSLPVMIQWQYATSRDESESNAVIASLGMFF